MPRQNAALAVCDALKNEQQFRQLPLVFKRLRHSEKQPNRRLQHDIKSIVFLKLVEAAE